MNNISENILFGDSIINGVFHAKKGSMPRIIFKDQQDGHSFAIDETTVFRNLLLLGGAGSGKTNVINQILAQIRYWNYSGSQDGVSLIFDTKGDYITHSNFYQHGDYVIANGRSFRDRSVSWNIFDEVLADGEEPENYEPNAKEIAAILFKDRGSQAQPFFCNAAQDIFANVLIYFIRRYNDNHTMWKDALNNYELISFMHKHTPADFVQFFSLYPDMSGLKAYIGDGNNNQALGVFGEMRAMLDSCFQGVFAQKPSSTHPSFSIRKAIREKGGKAIFILYDLAIGETLIPMYRLLVDLALKEALSDAANGHTHLFLDELKLLPKITHLQDALNFGRSKRVSVVAGLQSVGQIYSIYNEYVGKVILSGFGSIIALKTSDYESRDYITKLFGTNLTAYRYQNENNSPIDREREGNTVEQWHYRSLENPGQAIVGLASQSEPFFFYFEEDKT